MTALASISQHRWPLGIAAVAFLARVGVLYKKPIAGLLAGPLFATAPQSVLFAESGVETSMFVFLTFPESKTQ